MRRRAFTLVEMLVALGIIILLAGVILPAVMHARRAGRQTVCMNNLREIGRMIMAYADTNNDYVPLGTSVACNDHPEASWRTDWNDFISAGNAPMSALGPMLINGMIYQSNARLLFCPLEARETLRYDLLKDRFPEKGENVPRGTIKISYAARPVQKVWFWLQPCIPPGIVAYPIPMPRLDQFQRKALMAEPPERPPYNHGSESDPRIHVLYQDGTVRLQAVKAWADLTPKPWFELVDEPKHSDRENSSAMPVWEILDKEYGN